MANNTRLIAGLLCFASFLLFYGVTSRAKLQVSDEVAVFATGISLATQGDLAIDELQWLQDTVNIGQKGRDNHLYAKYFPGNVLSTAIVYRLTEKQNDQSYIWNYKELAPSVTGARLAMKINAVLGALAMTALLLLLRHYFDWRTTIVTVILVGICSDWWYQSRGFLSEVGAGSFLIVSLCLAAYKRPYPSSLALAVSILFRPTNLIALPVWGKAVWRDGLKGIWSGIAIVASVLALAIYNWARFGSPLVFGYGNENFGSSLFQGLYGTLLSPGRSLFIYSPVFILTIPGAWLFYRKEKGLAVVCLVTALGYVVTVATWHSWDGGWTWGSRLLTPVVPILGCLIAPVVEYVWKSKWAGFIILLLATLGLSVQVLALSRDPLKVMIDHVANGNIEYDETLYTFQNSWVAMQFRSLNNWQICDLDSYTLRHLLNRCSQ